MADDYDKTEEEEPANKKAKIGEENGDQQEELDKLWKPVKEDPTDFTAWTQLLQHVDTKAESSQAREAYEAFLHRYPYCYGYWKKFADYEKRTDSNDTDRIMSVFDNAIKAIPLSVDLWIHYVNYVKDAFIDKPEFVRGQYERAVATCGREWRSDKLWDSYVKWETKETENLPVVLKLYDRIIRNPTQGLSHQFEMFREFIRENNPKDMMDHSEFSALKDEVLESIKQNQPDKSPEDVTVELEVQAIKEKLIFTRRKVFKETEDAIAYRIKYEDQIKRPYFHVKPLERGQLKAWSEYLDHEIEKQGQEGGDESLVEVLFERCLIACALYEEFWLKYASWLNSKCKLGTEEERWAKMRCVFERAISHHLPKKVDIHLRFAAFEEERGDFDKASEILQNIAEKHPTLVSIMMRKVNLERRRGNNAEVHKMFRDYLARNDLSAPIKSDVSVKYSRYLGLVLDDAPRAINVIENALKLEEGNPKLYMQALEIMLHQHPLDLPEIVALLDRARNNVEMMHHKMLFSKRKLEFLHDFGSDIFQLTAAQEDYAKLTAHLRNEDNSADASKGDSDISNKHAVLNNEYQFGSRYQKIRSGARAEENGNYSYHANHTQETQ